MAVLNLTSLTTNPYSALIIALIFKGPWKAGANVIFSEEESHILLAGESLQDLEGPSQTGS